MSRTSVHRFFFKKVGVITRVMASSSAGPEYLNGMRCLGMSEKYSLASWAVLVPKPEGGGQQSKTRSDRVHHFSKNLRVKEFHIGLHVKPNKNKT